MKDIDTYMDLQKQSDTIDQEIIKLREKQNALFNDVPYSWIYHVLKNFTIKLNLYKDRKAFKDFPTLEIQFEIEDYMNEHKDLFIDIAETYGYHTIWNEDNFSIAYIKGDNNEL